MKIPVKIPAALIEVIRCFPEFLYAEVDELLQIRQRSLLSTFFPIHISLMLVERLEATYSSVTDGVAKFILSK